VKPEIGSAQGGGFTKFAHNRRRYAESFYKNW
jgi:hypothetical protein